MSGRLGNAIYWFGCGAGAILVGGPWIVFWCFSDIDPVTTDYWFIGIATACGLIVWLIGRAAKYILSGT
jgi:hypothetical protein